MNKKLEDQLQVWGKEEEKVPEFFSKGIDDALNNLPDLHSPLERARKKKRKPFAKTIAVSAAVFTFGIIGSGFVSPTMAKVLSEVPIVGSIFAGSSDSSLKKLEEKGLASKLNETVIDNGVSLTITEAFFGGGRLAISYIIETDKADLKLFEKNQGNGFSFQASINEKPFTYMAGFEQNVNDGVARGILDMGVGLESELPEKPVLQLNVNEISGIKGTWNFNIPVSNKETKAATTVFTPMVSTTWDKATFVVEKAEFTPAGSQIIIDSTMPREDNDHYRFAIYDENGTSLGVAGGSGSSIIDKGNGLVNFKNTILLPGRDSAPKGLIIEVFNNHGEMYDPSNSKEVKLPLNETKFPYTITYPNGSELTITNYEQLEDKTVLYYDIKGSLRLQNTFIILEDQNGESITSNMDAERTSLDGLSFKREFAKTTGPITLMTQVDKTNTEVKQIKISLD
ncbi:DUF4179 domain-containing protein [Bacillus sp. S/N-304-OC-R1]|uniref:DUF4179 domain-containing protein n=1 Tax=Bacillus sp. S/N-304-OC-R1 TaxID=2758034 RepID=UPI001C8D380A|nr:DUF4179 domain-containing protein [Bacillus sp. S/N-304-OC-R1]MBY0122007.1 DUF4179 domain-containing protein [Bacillus sp. S/N-304-OC-R1]